MLVNQVFELVNYCIAKNSGQGFLSPEEFNNIMPMAESGYFDFLRGQYQKYQTQRPISVVSFGENEAIRTSLIPLIYGAILNVNSSTGIAPYPSDFEFADAMSSVYGNYNIKFVQQDRKNTYLKSVIDPVTASNPIYLIQHEGFHFYPQTIGQAELSYLRTPPFMVYAYTIDPVTELPVYDPSNSRQPIWSYLDIMQIIVRGLRMMGINLQAAMVAQYAMEIKNGGQ